MLATLIVAALAVSADPVCLMMLGCLVFQGQGVRRDRRLAREWLGRAALVGEEDAREALESL